MDYLFIGGQSVAQKKYQGHKKGHFIKIEKDFKQEFTLKLEI